MRMLRPPELPDRVDPEEPEERPPLSGLLTLAGLAVVPPFEPCPWLPEAGASGLRMARGPVVPVVPAGLAVPEAVPPPARANPVDRSLRSMTRLPLIGSTEIFVPAGRKLRLRLVRLILVRPLSWSPRRALAEMCGSLR